MDRVRQWIDDDVSFSEFDDMDRIIDGGIYYGV
jgi:hypothetical protein